MAFVEWGRVIQQGRAVGVGIGLALLGVIVGAVAGLAGAGFLRVGGVRLGLAGRGIVATVLSEPGGFAAVAGGYVLRYGWPRQRAGDVVRWPTHRDLGWIGVGVVVLVAVQMGAGTLLHQLGVSPAPNAVQQLGERVPRLALWFVPVSLLVVGPAEELLFRGIIQGRLRTAVSPGMPIGLASAIFALPHLTSLTPGAGGSALSTVLVVFVVSLGLGAAYERTQNLIVPMMMHGGYNAVLFGVLFLSLTG